MPLAGERSSGPFVSGHRSESRLVCTGWVSAPSGADPERAGDAELDVIYWSDHSRASTRRRRDVELAVDEDWSRRRQPRRAGLPNLNDAATGGSTGIASIEKSCALRPSTRGWSSITVRLEAGSPPPEQAIGFGARFFADTVPSISSPPLGYGRAVGFRVYSRLNFARHSLRWRQDRGMPLGEAIVAAVGNKPTACNPAGTCQLSLVQVGRGACRYSPYSGCQNGTAQRIFVSYGRDPHATGCSGMTEIRPVPLDRGAVPGDTGLHYYRVWQDGSTWRFDHWPKGGTVVQVFSISASLICWTQREGLTFSESWNAGDALGGHAANHYNYMSMARLPSVGGTWVADTISSCATTPFPIYNCSVTASQKWEVWTNR